MADSRPKIAKLRPLEFRLFQRLKGLELTGSAILIACSGGMDSLVLLHALAAAGEKSALKLSVAYVHHGPSDDGEVWKTRNRAQEVVREAAAKLGLQFSALSDPALTEQNIVLCSEAQLRAHRRQLLLGLAAQRECQVIAFAHHADDLLETRLLRLIRGTGAQGLQAMEMIDRKRKPMLLRPLLQEPRSEVLAYAQALALNWSEDPTNSDVTPLRNWLRHIWLPELEKKRKGSTVSLARSLALISQEQPLMPVSPGPSCERVLNLDYFLALPPAEQRRQIAGLLLRHKLSTAGEDRGFSEAQVREIQKRLTGTRSRRTFLLAGLSWTLGRATQGLPDQSAKKGEWQIVVQNSLEFPRIFIDSSFSS